MGAGMLAGVLAAVMAAGSARGADEVVVFGGGLRETRGVLVKLEGGKATVRVGETAEPVEVEGVVALVRSAVWSSQRRWPGAKGVDGAESSASVGERVWSVALTDGSLARGTLLMGKGGGLILLSQGMGRVDVNADGLLWMAGVGSMAGKGGSDDRVGLLNGDVLEGFVEGFGPATEGAGLALTLEREKSKSVLALDRVAWVRIGGAKEAGAGGRTVWFAGDERSGAVEVSIEPGEKESGDGEARVVRSKGGLPLRAPARSVTGVLLERERLVPLSEAKVAEGSVERGEAGVLNAADLTLAGPGSVQWSLPAGAKRLSGWAVLPEECRQWGDCEVTIVAGSGPALKTFRLHAGEAAVRLDLDLPAGAKGVELRMSEGRNGPVQDRVVLRNVLIGRE